MKTNGLVWSLVVGSLCAGVTVSAVGCGTNLTCGEGTMDVSGRCVPTEIVDPITCGPGTRLDMMTICVPTDPVVDPTTCGAGTTLNPATDECEPDVTCATGTIATAGECVPDGTVICTGNTVFDATTGTCVVDMGACADGTVFVMGECIAFDDSLTAMIHAGAEPDDPIFFDGTPVEFTPPGIGETVTLDGCITPDDFDDTSEMTSDVDLDFFDFTVSGPGLYQVRVDGLHGLSAGFAILSPDPVLGNYTRIGLDLTSDGADRQIYLPRAGVYYLIVFDSRSLALDTLVDGIAIARPVGTTDTCYFMSIEALAMPTPTVLTGETAMGSLGDPQFFSTTATGATVFQALLAADSPAAQPAVVLAAGTDFALGAGSPQALAFSPTVADTTSVLVVVDSVFNYAIDPVDYTLTLTRPGQIPTAGPATVTHVADTYTFLWFQGTAGDVVRLNASVTGTNRIALDVINPGFTALMGNICTLAAPCVGGEIFLQLTETGRHVVRVYNPAGVAGTPYDITFARQHIVPTVLTPGTAAPVAIPGIWAFAEVDASAIDWARIDLTAFAGTGFTTANVRIFDRDLPGSLNLVAAGLVPTMEAVTGSAAGFSRIYGTPPGELLIAIRDSGTSTGDEAVTVNFREETFTEITVAPGTPTTRAGEVIPASTVGPLRYLLRSAEGNRITLTATGAAGVNPRIDQLDRTTLSIRNADVTGPGGVETLSAPVTASGWLAFTVSAGAAGGMADVTASAALPPYIITAGTRTYADICSAGGMEVLNADDAVTPARMLTTFSTFSFFGAATPRMIISTNGWLSFDTSYVDTGRFAAYDGRLADGRTPDAVIAPHWTDLVTRVCVRETGADLVVQWTGMTFTTPAQQVEMQVVLSTGGVIDLVYGPNHRAAFLAGGVGLEPQTGDYAVAPSLAMVGPSMSVRLTPR